MKIRLAKPCDCESLAQLHFSSREQADVGFFSKTSKSFLQHYYKLMLNSHNFVALCVEDINGRVVGFVTASLDASKQFECLHKNRFSLGVRLIPVFLKDIKLLRKVILRYRSTRGKNSERYVKTDGPRGEFWVWDSQFKNPAWSISLYRAHLQVLKALKVKNLYVEVDKQNENVFKFHLRNGAVYTDIFQLPDGRERYELVYDL